MVAASIFEAAVVEFNAAVVLVVLVVSVVAVVLLVLRGFCHDQQPQERDEEGGRFEHILSCSVFSIPIQSQSSHHQQF